MAARLGKAHHRARFDDDFIEMIRREYIPYVNGIKKLSEKYNVPNSTVRDWVGYYTRRSAGG